MSDGRQPYLRGRKNSGVFADSLSRDGFPMKTLLGESLKTQPQLKVKCQIKILKSMALTVLNH